LKREWGLTDQSLVIVPACVSDVTGNISFLHSNKANSHVDEISDLTIKVNTYALDDYFADKQMPTLIKADIEGTELSMLSGAVKIIKNGKPKLAISIYHSPADCVKIPEFISNLNCGYHMQVRNHSEYCGDTVLYCY
jgi:FkbM family methyltransferase